jgi:hypothetical protein
MDIRLLKIFRRRASKEICIRRQPGKRYEIVCPSEDAPLGYFFRDWVPINSQLASVTWEKIRRGYIIHHLVSELCKRLPVR